jgi:hypothetical protein
MRPRNRKRLTVELTEVKKAHPAAALDRGIKPRQRVFALSNASGS